SPTSTQAYVHLTDATKGYAFALAIPCSSTTLAWTGTVYPGNYKVTVDGQPSYSNLPDSAFVANAALAVTANTTGVALDVKPATVAGTLTLNGQAPTSDPACTSSPTSQKAIVRFADAKNGYSFDLNVPCSSSTFAWSGQIFPGTYSVSVAGSQYSNLPD